MNNNNNDNDFMNNNYNNNYYQNNQNNDQNYYQNNQNYYQNNNMNYNQNNQNYYQNNNTNYNQNNQNYYQNDNMNYNQNNMNYNQNNNQDYYQNNNQNGNQYDSYNNQYNNQNYYQNTNTNYYDTNQSYSPYSQNYNQVNSFSSPIDREGVASRVYTRSFLVMFIALLVTAMSASIAAMNESFVKLVYEDIVFYSIAFTEIGIVALATYVNRKKMLGLASFLFGIYTIMNGITLSMLFYIFEIDSIQNVFILTAMVFGIMAIIGATTKIDLSKLSSALLMALIGLILVSVTNVLFLHSSGLELALDYVGVIVFVLFTAYDTQKMKSIASTATQNDINRIALSCGIDLYLDFVNLFIRLLAIFGRRRN